MQQPIPTHPSSTGWWHPPEHVAKKLVMHAVRNIPHSQKLIDKCYPKNLATNQLPPHVYSSDGKLQWAFH